MNKNVNTETAYINALAPNDLFFFPASDHMMIAESVRSEGGKTMLTYGVGGTRERYTYIRPGLTTVQRVV